jgi:competence protein ComQ
VIRDAIDQAILGGIKDNLSRNQLSPEMLQMINSSLNADNKNVELFKWAHLVLMSCECVGGSSDTAIPGAIAMELAALAADIYDDIQDQDNDDLPWRQIPVANAINLAICLSMLSINTVTKSYGEDNELCRELCQIVSDMWITASDGQFQEFLYDAKEEITLDQYFELVEHKSGSLVSSACKIGATLGGASLLMIGQLEKFGIDFGLMNQIRNDLSDFLNFQKKNDFVLNKKTLPYVYLLNTLEGENAECFRKLRDNKENMHEQLKQLVVNEGAVSYCKVMYEIFRQKALAIIYDIPVSLNQKEKMIKLVEE